PGAPPVPVFMAPRAGMQTLTDALARALAQAGVTLRTDAPVAALEPVPGLPGAPLRLHLRDGETIDADGVILTTAAAVTADLIAPHAPDAAQTLRGVPYASVVHTALAYAPDDVPELPAGTGFLVPRSERLLMTACTFVDRKWPQRRAIAAAAPGAAPLADAVVIKCSAGRIDDARPAQLTDDALVATLHRELRSIIGLRGMPRASRVVRVDGGLPQYAPGHPQRIAQLTGEVRAALPALTLAGAAYRGASVPLCIRDGRAAADDQLARLSIPADGDTQT
ncbi:MAG: FAD-dependent oxidoreductase, partial [Patulibacter sp.]